MGPIPCWGVSVLRRFHSTIYSPIHYSFIHLFMYSLFNFSTLNYPLNINLVTYSSYHLLFKSLIICSFIHLFIYPFYCLPILPLIHLFIYLFIHFPIYSQSFFNRFIYQQTHLFIWAPIGSGLILSLFMSLHLLYHSSSLLSFC